MSSPARHPSPAELAALEQAFAADPGSEAYRALSEAYLGMGRFMEAMVVCRKGIRGHPSDPAPRVLLARIYAAQAKDLKAHEELAQALALDPQNAAAHRLAGALHLKAGDRAAAAEALRRAQEADPSDPETQQLLAKLGGGPRAVTAPRLAPERAEATPPPTAPAATPAPARVASPAAGAPSPAQHPPDAAPAPGTPAGPASRTDARPAPAPEPAAAGSEARAAPPSTPAAPPRSRTAYSDELASRYATQEYALHGTAASGKSRGRLVVTLVLGAALAVLLLAWGATSYVHKKRALEIDRALRQARELIDKDGFAAYQQAARLCEQILARDPDALGPHAYLAYVDALRWGEHGEGEALREEAKKHLAAVARLGKAHSHAYAADAYLRLYGGDARGAVAALQQVLAGPEGASALLRGALGVAQMQAGDLDGARDSLNKARQIAPGDVRTAQMLAEQWRRRGAAGDLQAATLYDTILVRLAPDHVPTLLGKAAQLVDGGQPGDALKRLGRVVELGAAASPREAAVAHALRAAALRAEGKAADADAAEQQARALDPESGEVLALIARRPRPGAAAPAMAAPGPSAAPATTPAETQRDPRASWIWPVR